MWIELKNQYSPKISNLLTGNSVELFKNEIKINIVNSPNGHGWEIEKFDTESEAQQRYDEIKNMLILKSNHGLSNISLNRCWYCESLFHTTKEKDYLCDICKIKLGKEGTNE